MDKTMVARIWIEVDLNKWLSEGIMLKMGSCSHWQALDYINIPFRCHICKEYGYLQYTYPPTLVNGKRKEKYMEEGTQDLGKKYHLLISKVSPLMGLSSRTMLPRKRKGRP